MYYLFEYTYKFEHFESMVLYVVKSLLQNDAILQMIGNYHEGYVYRHISAIREEEAMLFKEKEIDNDVWRVTRDNVPVMIELERIENEKLGLVIQKGSFTIMSSM